MSTKPYVNKTLYSQSSKKVHMVRETLPNSSVESITPRKIILDSLSFHRNPMKNTEIKSIQIQYHTIII